MFIATAPILIPAIRPCETNLLKIGKMGAVGVHFIDPEPTNGRGVCSERNTPRLFSVVLPEENPKK